MAYRKRSLDLPLPPGQTQSAAKHPRSNGALPPIRSLTEIASHHSNEQRLPSLAGGKAQSGKAADLPATRTLGDPSLSLASIRVSSPGSNPDTSSTQTAQPPVSAPADGIKVARNWSRDETLSLVRAIGRHYESLKRCKTNQERSNVWHRIHKEHSSQFPGRSKKASQDRWGKVLSDYKDVMVHNKEKGAARWTFDFFKEVAAIVEGDAQFMEAAASPPLFSPQPKSATALRPASNSDDLRSYSFGAASATAPAPLQNPPHSSSSLSSASSAQPPPQHHRMSEPNLPHMAGQIHHPYPSNYSLLRSQPPLANSGSSAQKLSPVELCPATAPLARDSARFSPSRRTSYPQMQAHAMAANATHVSSKASAAPAYPRTDSGGAAAGGPRAYASYPQRHSIQVLSSPPSSGSLPSAANGTHTPLQAQQPMATPRVHQAPSPLAGFSLSESTDPEKACRFVLDLLEVQVRKIDAQQDNLTQLRHSTQDAISKVERVLHHYTHPQQ
ncbi:hypothetical protein IWW36_002230 [Coemansia brasiliensis]|uniref:Myb-like domain-containing protein n=1 Tax=Coemansia brasiliensis TaxID=2650707 RepID=A0A9W8IDV4_9FUNG|nr:hypothetical protein IWW36_002230 [Coemansia brasiliensis]